MTSPSLTSGSTPAVLDHQETTVQLVLSRSKRWKPLGSTAERSAWITIITLLISACGLNLELDRLVLESKPATLQTRYTFQEFIPSHAFDIACQCVALLWMSFILILHFIKQWRRKQRQATPSTKEQVHLGSYLIYGLCFFALGGILRKILRSLLFLNYSCADKTGHVYRIVEIVYIAFQVAFIHCNRKKSIFNKTLLNGLFIFHTVVTNVILYMRVFVQSKLEIFNNTRNEKRVDCNCISSTGTFVMRNFLLSSLTVDDTVLDSNGLQSQPLSSVIIPRGSDDSCKLQNDVYLNMFEGSNMYLTPFLLEFALTAAAMLVEVWLEMSHVQEKEVTRQVTTVSTTEYGTAVLPAEVTYDSDVQISVSQKIKNAAGSVVVAIVVFGSFIFMLTLAHFLTSHSHIVIVFRVYQLIICLIMIGISITGLLVLNNNRVKSTNIRLDDILIYISIIGMICMSTFQIINGIASIYNDDVQSNNIKILAKLVVSNNVLWIVEAIFQSTFITKALNRIPQRTTGWFKLFNPCYLAVVLAACNLGMWLIHTISLESLGKVDHSLYSHSLVEDSLKLETSLYGKFLWNWIKLVLFPLMVFFRIHSFFTLLRVFVIHSNISMEC